MNREVRARIGTARLLLGSVNGPSHVVASKTQAMALAANVLQQPDISVEERAALMVLAAAVAWAEPDKHVVMQALAPAEPTVAASRLPMQNFMPLVEYFTEADWRCLMDPQRGSQVKQDIMFGRALKLGLRNPSEQTVKWLTCVFLLLTEPADVVRNMPSSAKTALMKFTKTAFKSMIRRVAVPDEFLERLPTMPEQLREQRPKLFEAAYECGEAPVACKIDLKQVAALDVSFRCRDGGSATDFRASQLLQVQPQGNEVQGLTRLFMDGMVQMQKMQHQMMANMSSGGSSRRPLQSLDVLGSDASLADGHLRVTAAPRLALLDTSHLVTPAAQAPAFIVAPANSQVPTLAVPTPDLNAAPSDAQASASMLPSAGPSIIDRAGALLNALEARGVAKKAAKDKEKAQAESQPATPSKPETPSRPVMKRPAAAHVVTPTPKKARLAEAVSEKKTTPHYASERSRKQIMCRTGLKGAGSTHAIKYGTNEKHETEAQAVQAAREWLKSYGVQ